MKTIREIDNFGDIAAEDDSVLDYFLTTEAAEQITSGEVLLVLGRKGSGKTALVRHFTETRPNEHGRPLSLRNYPWGTHQRLIDKGASKNEAYVASWRLLVAIRLASMLCVLGSGKKYLDSLEALKQFLLENFGTIEPDTGAIFATDSLKTNSLTIGPKIAGVTLGSITFSRDHGTKVLGPELNSLTSSILNDVSNAIAELEVDRLFLHFDELDQGLDVVDENRANMLIGLILAAREISRSKQLRANICPIVYLRTDIWDQLIFSDKNKITQSASINLTWDERSLKDMVNIRISKKLKEDTSWAEIEDGDKMRGSQPKWLHVLARTMLRPRDVIHFLNVALKRAKTRDDEPLLFSNEDINLSRETYSKYLKQEIDDEVLPHWNHWTDALQACSRIQTITFRKDEFVKNYRSIKSKPNKLNADEALELLYRFSVIGYERRSGGGGSSWSFKYVDEDAGWDAAAPRFKVHPGLKEFAKLKEKRV